MPNITPTQKFLLRILPKSWAQDMEADSRKWMLKCNTCGHERSVWDAGGIRWKAISKGKVVGVICPQCRQLKSHAMFKRV